MMIQAFAEPGKAPLMPGPLLRVPAGTEIDLTLHNALAQPLTFFVPASIHGGPDVVTATDSVRVAPGSTATLTTHATVAGNYVYRATTPDPVTRRLRIAGLLAGGLVVDAPHFGSPPHDQVFVIMETPDSAEVACADTVRGPNPFASCQVSPLIFTINGRSWPTTPRIPASVGDSLHWRVLNASYEVHPMHLHGFYFRVENLTGALVNTDGAPIPGQMVVTQAMGPFSTMSMSWSPDRPGNWLFHCHFAVHLRPDSMSNAPEDRRMRDMAGLVLGVNVAPRRGVQAAGAPIAARHVRLIALEDNAGAASSPTPLPSMRFVIEEHGRRVDTQRDFSPELDLVRGQPVAITIVNHLDRPTSVHWHGVEVEDSYADGVPGFSGAGRHLAPAIAPGDSFLARFTPPRAGTFMYHAHVDEVREQEAGLEGALIVRNPGDSVALDDHVLFFKGDGSDLAHPLEINGQANPDTLTLRVGRPARLRLLNLTMQNPTPTFWLTARTDSTFANANDTLVVRWRPIAKDGLDLPVSAQTSRLARQSVSMGETYDFEYTPTRRGSLQLEIRTSPPPGIPVPPILLIRVPIRVE
jgi:FtsP/CotA-like multicopper oxidase with cupredoxin domain